jgi:hypothetical protein
MSTTRTLLTNPKQVANVARNIGRVTNYHNSFQVFDRNNSLARPPSPGVSEAKHAPLLS